ncbi:transcription termination factor NusA [Patescibacteria group bacterium]|nr:transcription termination factor NusA [Patescibacteria group bacterium]
MFDKEFRSAIKQICDERGISEKSVFETIEQALAAAYRKDYGRPEQRIEVKLDPNTGKMKVAQVFEVVKKDEFENENNQILLKDAKKSQKTAKIGDLIKKKLKPHSDFGRIAAQTAKQVIIQRIREAERDVVFGEFKKKESEIINGTVQRIEGRNIIIDLGKTSGIMFPTEQVEAEKYYLGQRLKLYLVSVEESAKGPVMALSRSHPGLISELFKLEVPEISAGAVKIMHCVREAGSRTKIAVASTQEGVDPVGSCVGQRGSRVQAVLAEISEEKIDIVLYDKKKETYIKNALSPAKVDEVKIDKEKKEAKITVSEDQLSLAIGREGQNVRLASKLTGFNIDILKEGIKKDKK